STASKRRPRISSAETASSPGSASARLRMRRPRPERLIDVGIAALLFLAVWLLYHDVLRLWWTYDDGYHLHTAVTYSVWQYFSDPVVGRSIVSHLFTPLLQASYDVELSIFGLTPAWFYAVHLIQIAVAAVLVYATARLW